MNDIDDDDDVPLVVVMTIDVAAVGAVDDDSSFDGGGGGWSIVAQIVFVRTGISIYRSIYTYIHALVSVYQHRVCRRRSNIPFVTVAVCVLCLPSFRITDLSLPLYSQWNTHILYSLGFLWLRVCGFVTRDAVLRRI